MSKISRSTLAQVIADKLGDGTLTENKLSQEVAAYLISEKRTSGLESLLRDISQYRIDHDGMVEVEAISAHPLSDAVKADIEAIIRQVYPDAKRVVISEYHDASLIGGVRLELPNEQLDLSLRAKLNQFKQLTNQGA
ncbi:MAG TPA: F0F1 ATP synthase subunit delta [Candidatus Saccharimonadales bacterium]|nr:F0F1 ATP synthase subunit delta [Candidatus Saccharimonadales bacterium]